MQRVVEESKAIMIPKSAVKMVGGGAEVGVRGSEEKARRNI